MTTSLRIAENLYAGGQPTTVQLAELARNGVRTVINLRMPDEPTEYDEQAEVIRLGLDYVSLPIAGPHHLDRARVQEFGRALDAARRRGAVLIHCATANRVGAIIALDHVFNRGGSLQAALEHGRSAGLKSLEAAVTAMAQLAGGRP